MPTAGWILEGASDRFFEGTSTVPGPGSPPPPRFACPFCLASFPSKEGLRDHTVDQHVGSRPFFVLGGAEPASTDTIRRAFLPSDICLFNVTSILFSYDGTSFDQHDPQQLAINVSSHSISRIWLRLENKFSRQAAPIHTDYDLTFRIYSQDRLAQTDKLFVAWLGRADPSVSDVDRFLQSSRIIEAIEYADALGDYVLGVLVKDGDPRSGIRPGERDYRRRYNSALRTLQHFDRPLSQLVCGLIRFSSNDFSVAHETEFQPLNFANAWLGRLLGRGASSKETETTVAARVGGCTDVCPIDNGNDAVLSEARYLASRPRWSADIEARIDRAGYLATLDPLDRVKLLALWADTAIRLGQPSSALESMRKLVGNDCFGQWAESGLKEYESWRTT